MTADINGLCEEDLNPELFTPKVAEQSRVSIRTQIAEKKALLAGSTREKKDQKRDFARQHKANSAKLR